MEEKELNGHKYAIPPPGEYNLKAPVERYYDAVEIPIVWGGNVPAIEYIGEEDNFSRQEEPQFKPSFLEKICSYFRF